MADKNSSTFMLTMPSDREIILTRVFEAPRELVWKVWPERDMCRQGWSESPDKLAGYLAKA